MKKTYLWRDKHDKNYFCLGAKVGNGPLATAAHIFIDSFLDLGGDAVCRRAEEANGEPVEIEVIFRLPEVT